MKNIKIGKIHTIIIMFFSITAFLLHGCAPHVKEKPLYDYDKMDSTTESIHKKVESVLESCIEENDPIKISDYTRIDSVIVNKEKEHAHIYLNRYFAFMPLRKENTKKFYDALRDQFGWFDREYSLTVYATHNRIEELIPNFYRPGFEKYDRRRLALPKDKKPPLVRNIDKSWQINEGLFNKYIALWHSHGWYYEKKYDRWEWQRARLFQSVEDLGPLAYTLPYIVPMLENAGANVLLPRERDTQINEVIVDNDISEESTSYYLERADSKNSAWKTDKAPGFAIGYPPYGDWINPFKQGTSRYVKSEHFQTAEINWTPDIPERGKYAVYISYAHSDSNVNDAQYTIYHTGGKTTFCVNQQMGGHTWIYLGEFIFESGINPEIGKVVLCNKSKEAGRVVSADAVRFGGGMGNIIRGSQVSGRPRYMEGARYYLQYAGMPDTLVYTLSGNKNDYTDDYRSRGEWVNYLLGAPKGPNKNRLVQGLGIPIDASLAFHTDAGITKNDTVVGTLLIYSTYDADSSLVFPDTVSRFANRDFADIMQSQIVEDIRKKYDPTWKRRGLWDRGYSEVLGPNIPAVLLELLSHQNFLDMKFFHDPRFRFDVSRSIYKAILKFVATQNLAPFAVQPLPVTHFQAAFEGQGNVSLKWKAQDDPLEPSAKAEKYIVYTRRENNNFDNGIRVDNTSHTISNLIPGVIYSFKVIAVNAGGESFPSEILSLCQVNSPKDAVLIINGFDRIAGPATIDEEKMQGFANFFDAGVPYQYELNYTGEQYNFYPGSRWKDDDAPGFGSSYAYMEQKIIPGNTFDYTYLHGKAIRDAGYSFVSTSDEAIMDQTIDISNYKYLDLILGEEKKSKLPKGKNSRDFMTIPKSLQEEITSYCTNGGNLFISGAYVGTDLFYLNPKDSSDQKFAKNTLKFFWRTNYAAKKGIVTVTDSLFHKEIDTIHFNTDYHKQIYCVEAPDGIEPADKKAKVILRYAENNISAGIAYQGNYKVMIFGFPFETILSETARTKVMKSILSYFARE